MYSFDMIGGCVIENSRVLKTPREVDAWMVGVPTGASAAMLNVAVNKSPCAFEATLEKVNPVQVVERLAPVRLAPMIATATLEPCAPVAGLMLVNAGGALLLIVKLKDVENPFAVRVIGAFPTQALGAMLKVAV